MQPDQMFPPEAIIEVRYRGEWIGVKPGTFREFAVNGGNFVQFVDSADNLIVFLMDSLIEGWKVDPKLVVLIEEDDINSQIGEG